jgi:hypothetical protein
MLKVIGSDLAWPSDRLFVSYQIATCTYQMCSLFYVQTESLLLIFVKLSQLKKIKNKIMAQRFEVPGAYK